jgi:hypothetical protein
MIALANLEKIGGSKASDTAKSQNRPNQRTPDIGRDRAGGKVADPESPPARAVMARRAAPARPG